MNSGRSGAEACFLYPPPPPQQTYEQKRRKGLNLGGGTLILCPEGLENFSSPTLKRSVNLPLVSLAYNWRNVLQQILQIIKFVWGRNVPIRMFWE